MTSHFLEDSYDYLQPLWAQVFITICQFWGITFFFYVKNIKSLIKDSLHTEGIYFFVDHRKIITYIGKSKNLASRLKKSHEEYRGEAIIIIECPQEYQKAGYLEEAFRKVYRPKKNREGERKRR